MEQSECHWTVGQVQITRTKASCKINRGGVLDERARHRREEPKEG